MPRDIVSGDFYFVKQVDDLIYIAIADCTGHGVPGAFMSMLGIALLNEIVLHHTEKASEILDTMRRKIKTSLRQTSLNNEAKDGVDMTVCIWNTKNNELQFSGANSPLYLIRNQEISIYK